MMELFFNGEKVEIDDQTAIGIDIGTFDLRTPEYRKLNVSNAFTIPATLHNLRLLGHPTNLHNTGTVFYNSLSVQYYVNGIKYIEDGKGYISEINDRISVTMASNTGFWDYIKTIKFNDFITWMYINDYFDVYKIDNPYNGAFDDFIALLAGKVEAKYYITSEITDISLILTTWDINYYKCSVYLSYLYEGLKDYLLSNSSYDIDLTSPLFNDAAFQSVYIPVWTLNFSKIPFQGYYIRNSSQLETNPPIVNVGDKLTVFDFVKSTMQVFGAVPTYNDNVISFDRLDLIESYDIVDWSGKLTAKQKTFKPLFESLGQTNYISYKNTYDGGDNKSSASTFICKNENIEPVKDFINIENTYSCGVIKLDDIFDIYALAVNSPKVFDNFIYMADTTDFFKTIEITTEGVTIIFKKAAMYGLNNEYQIPAKIFEYPKVYEVEMWMRPSDLYQFDQLKQYYLKELGGCFYVNKIMGFNHSKSGAVKVQLIYLNDNAPITPSSIDFWADGYDNEFVDGNTNIFY